MADEQYSVYEHRLASFYGPQPVTKRRASNASSRASKALTWPHKGLSPENFAKAGFIFKPNPSDPDNVECFLCGKALCGWEDGDDPLREHLTHVPDCGWAVMTAVAARLGDYATVHPLDPGMIEARKATFAGKWPYESKKGWKCKTKQLAEAGWIYTPTIESDDMATCAYCHLALDGWEAGDKPIDEHHKRYPECPFFELLANNPPPKKVRGKAARATNMSRLSIQSVATTFSEVQSNADVTADHDDSVMTTASVMTQGGTKKPARGRKAAATTKTRKTRVKKDEAVEVLEDEQDAEAPPPPPKATRGRKRGSDAIGDPEVTKTEAPAAKKRATRGKAGEVVPESAPSVTAEDSDMVDAPAPPTKQPAGRKKGRASTAKAGSRKASAASLKSKASNASLGAETSDADQELERQLQADLERPLTDDGYLTADSESEQAKTGPTSSRTKKGAASRQAAGQSPQAQNDKDYAMFDPAPVHNDDEADVDAELKALEAEMNAEPEPAQQLEVPKKGRKAAGSRKVSKQTKKAEEAAPPPPSPPPPAPTEDIHEDSIDAVEVPEPTLIGAHDASSATVATKTANSRSSTGRPRGRPRKSSAGPKAAVKEPEPEPEAQPDVEIEPSVVLLHDISEPEHVELEAETTDADPSSPVQSSDKPASLPAQARSASLTNEALAPVPLPSSPPPAEQPTPSTPHTRHSVAPTHSAKQATISPSQTPQSSDAENQPPASRPAAQRIALAPSLLPAAATPQRNPASPSRRHVIGGIQSTQSWQAVDLDVVLALIEQSGGEGEVGRLLAREGKELSTPERNMSVEEWIFYNAGLAEEMLRRECESMVGVFEKEGRRAMAVLEGLVVE